MAYIPVDTLEVRIWNKRVGAVALDATTGFYAFEYAPAFLASRIDLAPLQMPVARGAGPYVFRDLPESTFYRLPAVLADALPDRFGNALIDAWMADNGVAAGGVTPLDRLAYMSSRGMGALTFRPGRGPPRTKSSAIEMAGLVEAARRSMRGELHGDSDTAAALKQIIQLGTSAGGARAKAVVAWNPLTREVRSGQFDMPPGFQAWLLKFDGVRATFKDLGPGETYGRIEYAYYLMATEAGIHMMPCQLLEENGRAHFMTRRFDRGDNGERHHMQSLCAMAHMDYNLIGVHSYSQLFDTILRLNLGREAMEEAFRRMVFNVLAANCDDHPKNFSFLMPEDSKKWELAPAYDVTHAYDPANKWVSKHLMSVNGKFDHIGWSDLRAVAERYDLLAEFPGVIERVNDSIGRWSIHAEAAGVTPEQVSRVANVLTSLQGNFRTA